MQNSRTLATWEFFGQPAGLLIFLPFYCTPMEDAPPDGPRMSSASCCSLLGLVPSPLAPSSQQLLEFPGHVRCLAFDARHLLPPLECLNLPDTGIQFSANAQLREAVQRRLAGDPACSGKTTWWKYPFLLVVQVTCSISSLTSSSSSTWTNERSNSLGWHFRRLIAYSL